MTNTDINKETDVIDNIEVSKDVATSEHQHHHHHHHHHDGSHHHGKHKDATGEYRKRMFNHVDRMRFMRKWGFRVLCSIAIIVILVTIFVYIID